MNIVRKIRREVTQILESADLLRHEAVEETLETPPQPMFGDLASNVCFSLSKRIKRSPHEISEEIVSKIKVPRDSLLSKVEAKKGYINFFFNYPKLAAVLLKTASKS